MAMTKTEQKIKDLSIDFLIKVSNAAMECQDTKESYKYSMTAIAAAIIISTPEGRNEFQSAKRLLINVDRTSIYEILEAFYQMAKDRGLYNYVKNEERQLSNKTDETTDPNRGRNNTTH
jgi:hypothetical protein